MRARRGAAVAALMVALSMTAAACTQEEAPEPAPAPTTPVAVSELSFGAWGSEAEIAAYQSSVDVFNSLSDESDATLRAYPDREAELADLEAGEVPDVFLVSRDDVTYLRDNELIQPVDAFLDERSVDVGDGYSREALEAFAADRRLQCVPYGISPMVIYYNTALVDFDVMTAQGLDTPIPGDTRWTLAEFAEAAGFATRPRQRTRGLYVAPTLRGLAPFVYSGGGEVYDDDEAPTSLDFSSDDTRDALTPTLELLRSAPVNLTADQVARKSPVEWFKQGRVAMIAGFRSLVPELRQVQGLDFDVMWMPEIEGPATIGEITGMCVSAATEDAAEAADLLVHLTSSESVTRVTRAGSLAPADQRVATSEDYLQPGRLPLHSGVFLDAVRSMRITPLLGNGAQLEAAVAPNLRQLVDITNLDTDTLDALTTQIDETSRTILDPVGFAEDQESTDPE